jgi:hypothetical protein
MGMKIICITENDAVEIPESKRKNEKWMKPDLANKSVLMVEISYETENRKPFKIIHLGFDRISFNEQGIYDFQEAMISEEARVKSDYMWSFLSDNKPLPIPIAPAIPTEDELKKIKSYLNEKYPLLLENTPEAFELTIDRIKDRHNENITTFKKTNKTVVRK